MRDWDDDVFYVFIQKEGAHLIPAPLSHALPDSMPLRACFITGTYFYSLPLFLCLGSPNKPGISG